MLIGTKRSLPNNDTRAKPYCQCWNKNYASSWKILSVCSCGEENEESEWKWEQPASNSTSSVVVSEDQRQVTFHPFYSSGTAAVRGDTAFQHGHHYYWEVKILSETYGTDIMVGIGTNKVNIADSQFRFTSLLGGDTESYGLSYRGKVRHGSAECQDNAGFCRGSIVGVRLDMWFGTLEFYLNRKAQGTCFYNLRRHELLYPMLCSTAAQSSMRLTYAASWRASLLVDAAKTLAAAERRARLPPGLLRIMNTQFWLTLPADGEGVEEVPSDVTALDQMQISKSILSEIMPGPYVNGYYVDNVERNYRVVVWE